MVELSDDELGVIFSSISDAKDQNSISLVCKQWLRVEGLTRTSLRLLARNYLFKLIRRFPNLTTFESSSLIDNFSALCIAHYCPKIETLNLNFDGDSSSEDITDQGLLAIAEGCRNLSTILLQNRKCIRSLVRFGCNLTCLDLSGCTELTNQALYALEKNDFIQTLILQGCSLITDDGVAMLTFKPKSKKLRKLILSGCTQITDSSVLCLSEIVSLEELSLADCGSGITEIGGLAIFDIHSLKKLDLSRLNVTVLTLEMVAEGCWSLVELTINGCGNITGDGISVFYSHKSLEVFNL